MNWENKNVLITGISGFVGPYVAEELLKKGANIYGLIMKRADGTKPKNLVDRGIVNDVHLLEGDLTDITSLANALDESKPDYIFHLAAQSFVMRSFQNPIETQRVNCFGTANLLESVRIKNYDPVILFAGSSEEYGQVIISESQHQLLKEKRGVIFPEPTEIPEIPIKETNPLRPMSPYAVSKVYGDYLVRNYYYSYGLKTLVSRAFNHEGAGRGTVFVTSEITNQTMKLKFGEVDKIVLGNVNVFRDWSHIKDIIDGYILLAEKGEIGDVYNQGSMRTNSVLSYILLSLDEAGWEIEKIETYNKSKIIDDPIQIDNSEMFGIRFEKTKIDRVLLEGEIEYIIEDGGILVHTDKGVIEIEFDPKKFRPAEVNILMSDTMKIREKGFEIKYSLQDIIRDQLNYFLKEENRA
jgi:GDPmannose 4,6-dehydratase